MPAAYPVVTRQYYYVKESWMPSVILHQKHNNPLRHKCDEIQIIKHLWTISAVRRHMWVLILRKWLPVACRWNDESEWLWAEVLARKSLVKLWTETPWKLPWLGQVSQIFGRKGRDTVDEATRAIVAWDWVFYPTNPSSISVFNWVAHTVMGSLLSIPSSSHLEVSHQLEQFHVRDYNLERIHNRRSYT